MKQQINHVTQLDTNIIKGNNILDFIPQRAPIVMVDVFYGIQDNCSYSGLTVQPDNIFMEHGHFNESGIIEHIAQSCALRLGYICKLNNQPVPVGYIGAVKNMKIIRLPEAGEQLYTQITIEQEIFGITLATAKVCVNDKEIAFGEMKIFLDKNHEEKE